MSAKPDALKRLKMITEDERYVPIDEERRMALLGALNREELFRSLELGANLTLASAVDRRIRRLAGGPGTLWEATEWKRSIEDLTSTDSAVAVRLRWRDRLTWFWAMALVVVISLLFILLLQMSKPWEFILIGSALLGAFLVFALLADRISARGPYDERWVTGLGVSLLVVLLILAVVRFVIVDEQPTEQQAALIAGIVASVALIVDVVILTFHGGLPVTPTAMVDLKAMPPARHQDALALLDDLQTLAESRARLERINARWWFVTFLSLAVLATLASGGAGLVAIQEIGEGATGDKTLVVVLALIGAGAVAISTALNPGNGWKFADQRAKDLQSLARHVQTNRSIDVQDGFKSPVKRRELIEGVLARLDSILGTTPGVETAWSNHLRNEGQDALESNEEDCNQQL